MEVDPFMRAFLAALLALSLVTPAYAGGWVQTEIKWRISTVGAPYNPTGIYIRDTCCTAIGPVDTTGTFSLDDADPIPRGVNAPAITAAGTTAPSDTTVVGYIVIQSDSSAAPTSGLTSATCIVDGRVGAMGPAVNLARGWVKADSTFINGAAGGTLTTGDESIAFPIKSISTYGNIARWASLRARITGAGTAMGAARVFVRYWDNDARPNQ